VKKYPVMHTLSLHQFFLLFSSEADFRAPRPRSWTAVHIITFTTTTTIYSIHKIIVETSVHSFFEGLYFGSLDIPKKPPGCKENGAFFLLILGSFFGILEEVSGDLFKPV
jgi:hypothetical protein